MRDVFTYPYRKSNRDLAKPRRSQNMDEWLHPLVCVDVITCAWFS